MLDFFYNILNTIVPFHWINHDFMKNALLAILLVTPLFGLLGTMVVSNKMAFFADSLGHGAYTGIAIGVLIGFVKPIWGATIFSILFAVAITIIKNKGTSSTDTVIGVFSSTAIALGLVLMSFGGNFNKFSSYLVGDLLSITPSELGLLLIVFVVVFILWSFLFNKLLIVSINPSLASSRGINTLLVEILFTSTIAIVVTLTVSWVGLLIINSLLILPAAASRNISRNVREYHLYAIIFSLLSGISGLILSYHFNTTTGATIVLVSSLLFFITLILKKRFR